MSGISTHILDLALGGPAAGVGVKLLRRDGSAWTEVAQQETDADGRCHELLPLAEMTASAYRIVFDTGDYFEGKNESALYPDVSITFYVQHPGKSYHMPLLLSANGYTTYRGS